MRKERAPKKEVEEYVEIDYENTPPPLVFVDGYNIIFYINSVEGRYVAFPHCPACYVIDLLFYSLVQPPLLPLSIHILTPFSIFHLPSLSFIIVAFLEISISATHVIA